MFDKPTYLPRNNIDTHPPEIYFRITIGNYPEVHLPLSENKTGCEAFHTR